MKPLIFIILLHTSLLSLAHADDSTYSEQSFIDSNNSAHCYIKKSNMKYASDLFEEAALRLFDVNSWPQLMGIPGQDFDLYAGKKRITHRTAAKGDLIRILLPLDPTNRSYWVKIESIKINIQKSEKIVSLVVRPTANPFKNRAGTEITDHFFTDEATNTFSVSLKGSKIQAQVTGHDEVANTYQVETQADGIANYTISQMSWGFEIRNRLVGFQSLTWTKLNKAIAVCRAKL